LTAANALLNVFAEFDPALQIDFVFRLRYRKNLFRISREVAFLIYRTPLAAKLRGASILGAHIDSPAARRSISLAFHFKKRFADLTGRVPM
jgi:hypothetical protein